MIIFPFWLIVLPILNILKPFIYHGVMNPGLLMTKGFPVAQLLTDLDHSITLRSQLTLKTA